MKSDAGRRPGFADKVTLPVGFEYLYMEKNVWDSEQMTDARSNIDYLSSLFILVNKQYAFPPEYVPEDLMVPDVPFSFTGFKEKKLLRKAAASALEDLFRAAGEEGCYLYGVSGYRSYKRQLEIYNQNLQRDGGELTSRYSAKPGHSEHQSGLAMDVSAISIHNRLDDVFAATPEGKFIANHAQDYGFILRYPQDKTDITGYAYEPWHIRYVGKELACFLHQNHMCLEEFYEYTQKRFI